MAGGGRFRPADRLRNSRDFQRVKRWGRRWSSPKFVVLIASAGAEPGSCRLGLTVSRRVGGAVVRNRVKRRVREWFRENRAAIGPGRDVVVIARPEAAGLESCEIRRELAALVGSQR